MSRAGLRVFAILFGALLVSAACGGTGTVAPTATAGGGGAITQGPPIKFGGNVAQTGPNAIFSQQFTDGYNFYKDTINAKGGLLVGNQRRPVELVFYDDKSDPTTGAKLTEKLITEDKVDFIWGSNSSALNFAASVIAEKYQRPMVIGGGGAADNIYDRGFKYVFTMMAAAGEYIDPVLDLAATITPKPQTVAILSTNDLFPVASADGAKKRAEALGMKVVYYEKYPINVQDLTTPIAQVKALNPDILIVSGYTGEQILAMKQMKEQRYMPKMIGMPNGPLAKDWATTLGKDGDYVIYPVQWTQAMTWKDPLWGGSQEYGKQYQAKYGRVPQYFEVQASTALEILGLGIEKCSCVDPVKVRDAIAGLNLELASGPLKFNANGRNATVAQAAYQVLPENPLAVVFPVANATGKLVYPIPAWDKR